MNLSMVVTEKTSRFATDGGTWTDRNVPWVYAGIPCAQESDLGSS